LLHAPFVLGLISGGAMIYCFTGASTQAVTTGAYRAVEFIKANIKLEAWRRPRSADSKARWWKSAPNTRKRGCSISSWRIFFGTAVVRLRGAVLLYRVLILDRGLRLYQAIFMANAGGAWDNAKEDRGSRNETERHAHCTMRL